MVKLFCTIIGDGSVFVVTIDEGQTVGDLKVAIAAALSYTGRPDLLQLFLAKTEKNAWLTYDEDLVNKLQQNRVDTSKLQGLWPPWKLNREKDPPLFGPNVCLGEDVVHVLVVVPAVLPNVLLIGVNEGYTTTISSYMEIAKSLEENKKVRSLSNYLASVVAKVKDDDEAPPFSVLENSSGTGKTQMAFNLKARGECDVFYIVCGDPGDREQPVYNAYATRTGTFQECVNQDLEAMQKRTLQKHVPLGSIGQIRSMQTLSLYGFILAALQGKDRFYGPKERSHVFDELRRRQESRMKPFVFFLDEFPRTGKNLTDNAQQKLENSLRMMRNVFRSFGLAVVLSSTNGTA
ncbi:hypothetical protein DVH05_016897 [Phytophthora capsici]|nr:hypothetical protein DVH05_016897 [Phytophthora capsici]